MRTLVGMVTFGNLKFSKLTLESSEIRDLDKIVVVGKPGDDETIAYLKNENIPMIVHPENWGFTFSLNDIYDYFLAGDWDNLILVGNDVIPYPKAIQHLENLSSKFDWVSAREYSVKNLLSDFPEMRTHFSGNNLAYIDEYPVWNAFVPPKISLGEYSSAGLSDCQNLNLYTRKAIETLGYVDVNFWPNGYFGDNDYVRRAIHLNVSSCTSLGAFYFHFWSRTINEVDRSNFRHICFRSNELYYQRKWNGSFGEEKFTLPFNGEESFEGLPAYNSNSIHTREYEKQIIQYWRKQAW